jgi:hypothetical protein
MAEKLTEQGIEKDQKNLPKGVDKPGEVRYIGKCAVEAKRKRSETNDART